MLKLGPVREAGDEQDAEHKTTDDPMVRAAVILMKRE